MLTSEPESQHNLESNEISHRAVVGAFRRKLKLSESAEKLALEASQCIDYGGQGYRHIDVNKLASSVSKAHVCDDGIKSYSGCELYSIFHTKPNRLRC